MVESGGEKRPGRPATPTGSSIGGYLRERRVAGGFTIRELARAVGLPASSAGYFSQLEAGTKVPNAELAKALADTLGDPKGAFPLWAQTSSRSRSRDAAIALRELARIFQDPSLNYDPRFTPPGMARVERYRELSALEGGLRREQDPAEEETSDPFRGVRTIRRPMFPSMARNPSLPPSGYKVPIVAEGVDPEAARESYLRANVPPELEFVRIDSASVGSQFMLSPFAYRMTETSIRRVATVLRPGDIVVFSRAPSPIVEHEIYAILHHGIVEVAHALWNDSQLLILPDTGKSDFVILPAPDLEALNRLVIGHMVTVVRNVPGA